MKACRTLVMFAAAVCWAACSLAAEGEREEGRKNVRGPRGARTARNRPEPAKAGEATRRAPGRPDMADRKAAAAKKADAAKKAAEAKKAAAAKRPPKPAPPAALAPAPVAQDEAAAAEAIAVDPSVGPTVVIVPDQDVVYLRDGTTVEGTVVLAAQVAVIILTEQGEQTIPRRDVLRIQYRYNSDERKACKTKIEDGHIYLTNEEAELAAAEPPAEPAAAPAPKQPKPAAPKPDKPRPKPQAKPAPRRPAADAPRDERIKAALEMAKKNPDVLRRLMRAGKMQDKDIPPELKKQLDQMLRNLRKEPRKE